MSHPKIISIAGKVFILGEYAVLASRPAVVAAVGPRFFLRHNSFSTPGGTLLEDFHPQSPVGRLSRSLDQTHELGEYLFYDPHEGRGGFGASSAQFALVDYLHGNRSWTSAYQTYRDFYSGERVPPSGADLVTQWLGGVQVFDPAKMSANDVSSKIDWSDVLVFSCTHQANRKTPTHEHLGALSEIDTLAEKLSPVLDRGIASIQAGDSQGLGSALGVYADILHEVGLEDPQAYQDRKAFQAFPEVAGVKGAGAMLSDLMIVLLQPGVRKNRLDRVQAIVDEAFARGLVLVNDGISIEKEILWHE